MDGDMVHVQKYRVNPLPPRVGDNGLLNSNHVRLDLVLSPPTRLNLGQAKETVESSLIESGAVDHETIAHIRTANDLPEIVEQLKLFND